MSRCPAFWVDNVVCCSRANFVWNRWYPPCFYFYISTRFTFTMDVFPYYTWSVCLQLSWCCNGHVCYFSNISFISIQFFFISFFCSSPFLPRVSFLFFFFINVINSEFPGSRKLRNGNQFSFSSLTREIERGWGRGGDIS